MNIPTHTSDVIKFLNFLQVSNYIFQLLHSNTDEEIESSLFVINQIYSHNTRSNNHMQVYTILSANRSKTKYCVLHNGMITWNFLPDVFKVNSSFSTFKCKVQNFYQENFQELFVLSATKITFFLTCVHLLLFKCNCFRF